MVATNDPRAEPLASLPENTAPLAESGVGGRRVRLGLVNMLLRLFPRRISTREASELASEQRERESLMSHRFTLEAEAEYYARLIPDKLENLNICYRYKKSEKDSGERVKKVTIRKPYILRDEAIYLHVDLRPAAAPRGVKLEHLADPDTMRNLSLVCGHKVLCKYSNEKGFYYIVEREMGVRGIPVHVKYDEILSGRPASADGLSLPFGVGENKHTIWKSLAQMQSMLVAGTTGAGKSNVLNVLICTLLRYNSKRRLKLMLVDLKGGVEFSYYVGVPHLLPISLPPKKAGDPPREAAIIEDRQDVVPAFEWIVGEGERRLGMLKADHSKHIGEYNYHHQKEPMAHIVCIVDEWADVKLEPKLGKEAEELLINIASRFRAVGIHMIICTQTPNKDVVSIRVKNVLPARLAFACPNIHSSMLIIGNGRAAGLEPSGRAIFDWGQTQMEIQTPLINNLTVDEMVASAIRGQWEEVEIRAHDVTDQEIFTWAIRENDAKLQSRELWGKFRMRGLSKDYAEKFCKDADGKTVLVDAGVYKVVPGDRRVPRRMLPITDEPEGDQPPAAAP
jgi:FtsK/SpoIIIE family